MDAKTAFDWLYAVYFLIVSYADGSMHKTSSKNWHSYYLQNIHRKGGFYPFISTGVDLFGPFFIENKNQPETHYAVISNCLTTRAAHLESCQDLDTDTYLNALARFTAKRGTPKTRYSDNGKTFAGASNEPMKCIKELDKNKNETKLTVKEIEGKLIRPDGHHFVGAW